ncbi:hypothetical protein [uncultured Rikenella sp.]|uniref:hypothetical protein n=1 Tax=uncultured Rikenella sp. TaxID=368003 RepID=UPI0025DAB2E8|nr:hypothetical protein [uncultured Rikenella sp.]
MKKKVLFGAFAALCLSTGITAAVHYSDNILLWSNLTLNNVESFADCEVHNAGTVIASCVGETGTCSLPASDNRTVICKGVRQ